MNKKDIKPLPDGPLGMPHFPFKWQFDMKQDDRGRPVWVSYPFGREHPERAIQERGPKR